MQRLRIVPLDELPLRIRTGGIEIAQDGDPQAICSVCIYEELLADELGPSVWIDRTLRRILRSGKMDDGAGAMSLEGRIEYRR